MKPSAFRLSIKRRSEAKKKTHGVYAVHSSILCNTVAVMVAGCIFDHFASFFSLFLFQMANNKQIIGNYIVFLHITSSKRTAVATCIWQSSFFFSQFLTALIDYYVGSISVLLFFFFFSLSFSNSILRTCDE